MRAIVGPGSERTTAPATSESPRMKTTSRTKPEVGTRKLSEMPRHRKAGIEALPRHAFGDERVCHRLARTAWCLCRPIAADDTRCGFALNRPSRTAPRAWIPSQSVPGDREHTLAVQSSLARPHGHGRGTCESPTSIRARRQPTNGCSAGPERSHNRQRRLQQPDDVLMHIQRLPASGRDRPARGASLPEQPDIR